MLKTLLLSQSAPQLEQPMAIEDVSDEASEFLMAAYNLLPSIAFGIALIVLCYFLAKPISKVLVKPVSLISDSQLIYTVCRRFISVIIILFGVYVFLKLVGLTEFALAIMSGTGLLGLILGFAFRDIAENFIASMLLSVQRPFKLNDVVEVNGYLGVIKKVTARATTLVDFDGNHIQIPNSTIYKNVIKNLTANSKMRGSFVLGIGYDNDIRHAQKEALTLLHSQEAVLDDPPPQVLISDLGSSTVNFTVYFWIDCEQHSLMKVASQQMRELVNRFTELNISMPDDARERILITPQQSDTPAPAEQVESKPKAASKKTEHDADAHTLDDLSSDAPEIREQAQQARDPEQGDNII